MEKNQLKMSDQRFKSWLDSLKNIWERKTPETILDMCADKFLWYETPFIKPLTTKKELLKEWNSILNQDNISFLYKIISVNKNVGIAKWDATFTRLPSKEEVSLQGIFQITLDKKDKCVEFHQWFNTK